MGNMNIEGNEAIENNSSKHKEKIKILFVCLGNICRSPAAEGIMQSLVDDAGLSDRFVIDSAGTGHYHVGDLPDSRMRAHARRRGYELTHICCQIRVSDFDDFDLIVGMDADNIRNLKHLAPTVEAESKIVPMAEYLPRTMHYDHIPDPYYEGAEGFELVLDLLENACAHLLTSICPGSAAH